jgi:hypothetical protein
MHNLTMFAFTGDTWCRLDPANKRVALREKKKNGYAVGVYSKTRD